MSPAARIFDPARLAAVRRTGLLDTGPEEAFDRLAGLAATLLDAPYAFVTVVDDRRSFWKSCIGIDSADPADRQNAVEESFCQYVIGSDEPLIVGDTAADPRTRENPSIVSMSVAAWAGFPLRAPDGQVLGTFCVVDTRVRTWTERDQEILRTLSLAAAGEIALRGAIEQIRLSAERSEDLARSLQATLLPPEVPPVPGIEVAARYRPAGTGVDVVGDFFDVFEDKDAGWHVVIGDVCGKGVAAATTTALARWSIRSTAHEGGMPSGPLERLNADLLRLEDPQAPFLTAIHAVVSRTAAVDVEVRLSVAGHPPPLVRRAGGTIEPVDVGGSILGQFPELTLANTGLRLAPGDALILYTDGVTEARGAEGFLGEARLTELLIAAGDGDADAIAESVDAAVLAFSGGELRDDSAIVVLRVPA